MPKGDGIRLRHMLDAAQEAVRSVQGRARSDLDRDRVWTLGLVTCVKIIGEAAGRVGPETRSQYPQIPWMQIIAMRNRLVHGYFDMDLDQVWKAVTEDIPPLISELEIATREEGKR
jgi:uncharacterized protein with HEPN domain